MESVYGKELTAINRTTPYQIPNFLTFLILKYHQGFEVHSLGRITRFYKIPC